MLRHDPERPLLGERRGGVPRRRRRECQFPLDLAAREADRGLRLACQVRGRPRHRHLLLPGRHGDHVVLCVPRDLPPAEIRVERDVRPELALGGGELPQGSEVGLPRPESDHLESDERVLAEIDLGQRRTRLQDPGRRHVRLPGDHELEHASRPGTEELRFLRPLEGPLTCGRRVHDHHLVFDGGVPLQLRGSHDAGRLVPAGIERYGVELRQERVPAGSEADLLPILLLLVREGRERDVRVVCRHAVDQLDPEPVGAVAVGAGSPRYLPRAPLAEVPAVGAQQDRPVRHVDRIGVLGPDGEVQDQVLAVLLEDVSSFDEHGAERRVLELGEGQGDRPPAVLCIRHLAPLGGEFVDLPVPLAGTRHADHREEFGEDGNRLLVSSARLLRHRHLHRRRHDSALQQEPPERSPVQIDREFALRLRPGREVGHDFVAPIGDDLVVRTDGDDPRLVVRIRGGERKLLVARALEHDALRASVLLGLPRHDLRRDRGVLRERGGLEGEHDLGRPALHLGLDRHELVARRGNDRGGVLLPRLLAFRTPGHPEGRQGHGQYHHEHRTHCVAPFAAALYGARTKRN